ncbi:MAG: sulfur carrier protein ThiS [Candidatus Omnitrophica bacterium]|nr:sulfur carrier protein ThiS [Candidatus Omnitrophota bacterium]
MKVTINGTVKELPNISYLSEIVTQYCKEPKHVITEVNGQIIPANLWGNTALKDGDTIELVAFVGGG